ncbi:hypothetical protein BDN70DRAFT_993435 [Pholiota conissans]|uniref:Fungal-type protein kinase domain-containing protein n=1 Tax=Pholiota conissans TaxID=109636 RepID=A0A9P5Z146_9AGAR|nr:hypothetical protein BDN70DRAFT_993435 [Pholiota conissans]
MKGKFAGRMPEDNFFSNFMQLDPDLEEHKPTKDTTTELLLAMSKSKEAQMYSPLLELEGYAPGLAFVDSHSVGDPAADGLSPDICIYASADKPQPGEPKVDFAKMSTFIEVKKENAMDPFDDSKEEFERDSGAGQANRSQIGRYSAAISGTQFRVHLFTVSISGNQARFIYWDRAAAVVSRSFDYIEKPHILAEFFWRYSRLSPRDQGFDTTVSAAAPEEVSRMEKAGCLERIQEANKENHLEFRKMMVPDREDMKKLDPFLISYPPCYDCRSPFSRSTRSMLAFDLENDRAVFIKDYWRPNVDTIPKEGDIYQRLEDANVQHIAPFGKGNDLEGHVTKAQTFAATEIVGLQHYRMSLNRIGIPLTEYESSKELISVIADAMEAHDAAYHKCGILHRDISDGNMMIYIDQEDGKRKGMLIDWDLCFEIGKNTGPRRPARTGTWQFMSVKLLRNPTKIQTLEDDRESAFWVLLWVALQHSQFNSDTFNAKECMNAFDELRPGIRDTEYTGGLGKESYLLTYLQKGLRFTGRPEMDNLMAYLSSVLRVRYEAEPSQTLKDDADLFEKKLEEAKQKGDPSEIQYAQIFLRGNVAHLYKNRMSLLTTKGWFTETLRAYVAKGEWPKDKASPMPRYPPSIAQPHATGAKRKTSPNEEDLNATGSKTDGQNDSGTRKPGKRSKVSQAH